ncbi:hypothetical protein QE152_g6772 [Popillia japonica]|uniref:Uncharacterized protein n=1 Tax=Popillia japonica TaxID=7064 RepID=A0AAW1MIW6_POPJA
MITDNSEHGERESDQSDSENSENFSNRVNLPKSLRGKNGHRWCSVPNIRKRVARRNILHIVQGPIGEAREADTPLFFERIHFSKHFENSRKESRQSSTL